MDASYTFGTSGNMTVTHSVISGNGCAGTTEVDVTVHPKPNAGFTVELEGFDWHFIPDETGLPYYKWNFGDGHSSSAESPLHRYAKNGEYTVTLETRNEEGCVNKEVQHEMVLTASLGYAEENGTHKVYPNPFSDRLTVELQTGVSGTVQLVLYDASGRIVTHTQEYVSTGEQLIGLSIPEGLSSGLYLLEVHTPEGSFRNKVQLQR
jgi:PKD repeat protein